MEESKENINQHFKNVGGNFFGWKWSFISLGIIMIGIVAIIIIKPTGTSSSMFDNESNIKGNATEILKDSLNK